jgi:hypothetical protein
VESRPKMMMTTMMGQECEREELRGGEGKKKGY